MAPIDARTGIEAGVTRKCIKTKFDANVHGWILDKGHRAIDKQASTRLAIDHRMKDCICDDVRQPPQRERPLRFAVGERQHRPNEIRRTNIMSAVRYDRMASRVGTKVGCIRAEQEPRRLHASGIPTR
jgi:hypothetical protein